MKVRDIREASHINTKRWVVLEFDRYDAEHSKYKVVVATSQEDALKQYYGSNEKEADYALKQGIVQGKQVAAVSYEESDLIIIPV